MSPDGGGPVVHQLLGERQLHALGRRFLFLFGASHYLPSRDDGREEQQDDHGSEVTHGGHGHPQTPTLTPAQAPA